MAGDPMMQMHVLLSDRVAYYMYRTFVLDIRFWTQLNLGAQWKQHFTLGTKAPRISATTP